MQSESNSREIRTIEYGSHEDANGALHKVFLERDFLLDQFSLRAQFDWKVARKNTDLEVCAEDPDGGLSTIFRSPSERVFTREKVIDFLGQLRKMAAGRLRTRHASTPQMMVLRRGHHTWIEKDASVAPWRYMYFMGPLGSAPPIVVVIETCDVMFRWFPWLTRTRTAKIIARPNDVIMYRSIAVQSLTYHPDSIELKDQTIILSGWLW